MLVLSFRSDFFALHQIIEKYSEQVVKGTNNLEKNMEEVWPLKWH